MLKLSSSVKIAISTFIIAVTFSSITLWLIKSSIKYIFFIFEIFVIAAIYLIVNNYEIKLSIKYVRVKVLNFGLLTNILFILSAFVLLAAEALHIQCGILQLILALLVTSILPGYALLNIFRFTGYFSRLETVVLSYIVSYIFTGFLVFILLPISSSMRTTIILGSFITLGLISTLEHEEESIQLQNSFSKNIDILALVLATFFYLISIYLIYPGFAILPGTDISRHYANSIILWRTPELYTAFAYFLAHAYESAFIVLSGASLTYIQTALVTLNLMLPLTFYVMAKSYLEDIDRRLPIISTIFYSTFSSFAWIYLAKLKLENMEGTTLKLLSEVNDKSYSGAMYLAQPFLWYVPVSVSFTILIIQLFLLRKFEISRKSFIALFSFLTITSYLAHVTEAVIFSIFLCFYAFLSRSKELRLDDAILASLSSFIFIDAFYVIQQYLLGKVLQFSIVFSIILPTALLFFTYVYRRLAIQTRLSESLSRLVTHQLLKTILYIITFFYLLGLVVWITGVPRFHTWAIGDIGSIPWFIYPVILGVIGILTLASSYYLIEDNIARRRLMPFIALIVFSFIFGKVLTFINVNLFYAGYWEKRFTGYFFLASAVVASLSMIKVAETVRTNRKQFKSAVIAVAVVSIIVVYGVQSTYMVLEYWNTSVSNYSPSEKELEAIDFLKNVLQHDKYAYTITLTRASYNMLTFAAPPYKLTGMQVVGTAVNPEMSLFSLKAHNLTHAYLYMHSRDFVALNKYGQSWLARHLISTLPVIYRNEEVTIYNASSVSFPQINSTAALLVPFDNLVDPQEGWLYSYDILSLGEYNYTVAYDLDPTIFAHNTLILSLDPPQKNVIENIFQDDFHSVNGWASVSGDWKYSGFGLEAGKIGEYQDAILLSPVSSQNFTASIIFKPIDGDLKVANYVSIIYDWRDKNNFKYAGLMFDGSGIVYAYFLSCENGVAVGYPEWPGLNTGLKWKFGDTFNLTVSASTNEAELRVNGSTYLTVESNIAGGKLGIRMTRFYKVLFTHFEAKTSIPVQLRDINDYEEYVKEGGRIIVLNTNGYGYFAERMFNITNSYLTVNEINGSEKVELPAALEVPLIHSKDDVKSVAYYKSQQGSSVYIAKKKLGSGEMIYVNVYPIIKALESSGNKSTFYKIFLNLLKPATLYIEKFTYAPPPLAATFRSLNVSGSVEAVSPSILFPLNTDFKKVQIIYANGTKQDLIDTSFIASNYTTIHVTGNNLFLSNGKGFYSTLTFKDNVTMAFIDNADVTVLKTNGTELKLKDVKTIKLEDESITIFMRQPTIEAQGLILFKELYYSSAVYQKLRAEGQDLEIKGNIRMAMYLSDIYSWPSILEVSGTFERKPPIIAYDELTSLPQTLFWSIILAPIFLATIIILSSRERRIENSQRL